MDDLSRLLSLVMRDLDARDARIEIGGAPPTDPRHVCVSLRPNWRLVAIFDDPPPNADAVQERLRALFDSFHDTGLAPSREVDDVTGGTHRGADRVADELADMLALLTERTGAEVAAVIDERSPVLWGTSRSVPFADIEEATRLATMLDGHPGLIDELVAATPGERTRPRLEDTGSKARFVERLLSRSPNLDHEGWSRTARLARAIQRLRDTDPQSLDGAARMTHQAEDLGIWARRFAGIYWLVETFPTRYSELSCEGPSTRALPIIERLVMNLPPVDPEPKGGRLLAFLRSVD